MEEWEVWEAWVVWEEWEAWQVLGQVLAEWVLELLLQLPRTHESSMQSSYSK